MSQRKGCVGGSSHPSARLVDDEIPLHQPYEGGLMFPSQHAASTSQSTEGINSSRARNTACCSSTSADPRHKDDNVCATCTRLGTNGAWPPVTATLHRFGDTVSPNSSTMCANIGEATAPNTDHVGAVHSFCACGVTMSVSSSRRLRFWACAPCANLATERDPRPPSDMA
eukprot:CAMPEP_0194485574 /NCGR_PEP_ID=MMETSP0253-20130528/6541_1 /TAXON_ID=2966 /ORGANISM="Noctiluca scintillans" /LENGTH=169 /DNA_ID=CAMNT_0039325573 /DNA_START=402 /DNA_END=909 /DNA_ORIENTATION=-